MLRARARKRARARERDIRRETLKSERNERKRGAHERRMEFGRAVLGMNALSITGLKSELRQQLSSELWAVGAVRCSRGQRLALLPFARSTLSGVHSSRRLPVVTATAV